MVSLININKILFYYYSLRNYGSKLLRLGSLETFEIRVKNRFPTTKERYSKA